MTNQKVICKSCTNEIAQIKNGKLIISEMKSVSIVEVNLTDNSKDIKCRCSQWNSFDADNTHTLNYKRKAQDALYSQYKPRN